MSAPPLGTGWRVYASAQSSNIDLGSEISYSCRLNSSDSAYMSRTFGSPDSTTTWTLSMWVKRGKFPGTSIELFTEGSDANNRSEIGFGTALGGNADSIYWFENSGGSTVAAKGFDFLARDAAGWYHLVFVWDSSNGTPDDRMRVYVNGVRLTDTHYSTNPSSGYSGGFNAAVAHSIGRRQYNNDLFFDGYVSDVYFVDGYALDPTSFGRYSGSHENIWVPKSYSGSYGTNGFHLDFADSADLGNDVSGNANDFTTSNLAAEDRVTDTPTNNFAVLNPTHAGMTLQDGNLYIPSTSYWKAAVATMAVSSGKWYYEAKIENRYGSYCAFGWVGLGSYDNADQARVAEGLYYAPHNSTHSQDIAWEFNGAKVGFAGTNLGATANLYDTTTYYFVTALDLDNNKVWFGYATTAASSITWTDGGDPDAGTGGYSLDSDNVAAYGPFAPALAPNVVGAVAHMHVNFGNGWDWGNSETDANGYGNFRFPVPSGFKALCHKNLPAPTVEKPWEQFNILTWTGTGSSNALTGVGFQPDLVWVKKRSGSDHHEIQDAIRGATQRLQVSSNAAESTVVGSINSFDSDGFTVGDAGATNESTYTYVGWNWKANGSGVANSDGSISSTVSVSSTDHFSMVSYTGTGSNATVGHGLSAAPECFITKARGSTGTSDHWPVWHSGLTSAAYVLYLHTSYAQSSSATVFNSTAPTSTVFSIGTWAGINASGVDFITYCFRSVPGVCKVGSYRGNGSTDGSFVWCGFRPRFILIKNITTGSTNWVIYDTERSNINVVDEVLVANSNVSEYSGSSWEDIDIVSNGFKCRRAGAWFNTNAETYIFIAMAEIPFVGGNLPPGPAR